MDNYSTISRWSEARSVGGGHLSGHLCHNTGQCDIIMRMREMSIRELRDSLSSIGEIVERDGEVLLTRHGRPVVKLVAVNPCRTAPVTPICAPICLAWRFPARS